MKIKIRFIFVIFAALLLALPLSSCAQAGKIRITVGMWPDDLSPMSYEAEIFNSCKKRFESDYPQYEIAAAPYEFNEDTVTAKAVSGKLPTVFAARGRDLNNLAKKRYIRPLAKRFEERGWKAAFKEAALNAVTANGEIYALPFEEDGLGLLLNLKLLKESGVIKADEGGYVLTDTGGNGAYPLTFYELKAAALKVRDKYGAGVKGLTVMSEDGAGGRQFQNVAWNFGWSDFSAETGLKFDAAAVEALKFLQDMGRQNLLYNSYAYVGRPEFYEAVVAEKAAMAFCTWRDVTSLSSGYGLNPAEFAFVPLPTGDGSSRYSLYDVNCYVFSSGATDAEVDGALEFLRYLGETPSLDAAALKGRKNRIEALSRADRVITPRLIPYSDLKLETAVNELNKGSVNVPEYHYKIFRDAFPLIKRRDFNGYSSAVYSALDRTMQEVLLAPASLNPPSLLSSLAEQINARYYGAE